MSHLGDRDSYNDEVVMSQESAGGAAAAVAAASASDNNSAAELWRKSYDQCIMDLDPDLCTGCVMKEDNYVSECLESDNITNDSIKNNLTTLIDNLNTQTFISLSWDASLAKIANNYPINVEETYIDSSKFSTSCMEDGKYVCDYPEGVMGYSLVISDDDLNEDATTSIEAWNESGNKLLSAPWQNIRNFGCSLRSEDYFGNEGSEGVVLTCLTRNE